MEYSATWFNVIKEDLFFQSQNEKVSTILPEIRLVHDTVLYGMTGPIDGSRYFIRMQVSPKYSDNSFNFQKVEFDYRRYWRVNWFHSFAARISAGASFGPDAPDYFLGGTPGWINWSVADEVNFNEQVSDVQNLYFSEFKMPLRGASYYQLIGKRFVLSNYEFRFPMINRLDLGWPLPLRFPLIMGAIFTDIGLAWGPHKLMLTKSDGVGNKRLEDGFLGYGIGARIPLGFFMLKIDMAWANDLNSTSKPRYFFSLGSDF